MKKFDNREEKGTQAKKTSLTRNIGRKKVKGQSIQDKI